VSQILRFNLEMISPWQCYPDGWLLCGINSREPRKWLNSTVKPKTEDSTVKIDPWEYPGIFLSPQTVIRLKVDEVLTVGWGPTQKGT
jgi:hypothetical protein